MKKNTFTRDFKIGFVAISAIFLLYFGLNFLKGVDIFSSVNKYHGSYQNLGGLIPSAPVYIKGMKVGQVDAVDYDFQRNPAFAITISVNKDIALPIGTQMLMIDDGLMGGKAIQLELPQNPSTAKLYAHQDTLPTQVQGGLLDRLTSELLPKINSAMSRVDSLLGSVQNIVNSDALQNSLHSIEATTSDLAQTSESLKQFAQKDVPALSNNLKTITGDFAEVGGELKQIDFNGIANSVDTTLNNLQIMTSQINDKEGTIGLLMNDKMLYNNLTNTVLSADSLLIDLKTNPKRYVHFSVFGRKDSK